jgi:hypothetical protein
MVNDRPPPGYETITTGTIQAGDYKYSNRQQKWITVEENNLGETICKAFDIARKEENQTPDWNSW